jgi:orotate phosphoribosyltransferase
MDATDGVLPDEEEFDAFAGLELGGIPIATALSMYLERPCAFVRKTRKDYGTCRIAEGYPLEGKRVQVIEDVITTGGQVLDSVDALRNEGALVVGVTCLILRGDLNEVNHIMGRFAEHDLKLRPLFTMADLQPFMENK